MGAKRVEQSWLARMLTGDATVRLEARIDAFEARTDAFEARIDALEARIAAQAEALAERSARITALEAEYAAIRSMASQLADLADATERQRLTLVGYDRRLHWHADEVRKLGTALFERIESARATPASEPVRD